MRRKSWLALAGLLIFGLIGWTASGQRQRPTAAAATQWEYRVVFVPSVRSMSESRLNELGAQGWELVAFQPLNQEALTKGAGNFYLKRLKQNRQ